MIEAGYYPMRVVEADLGYTSKQRPQVALLLEIKAGAHAGEAYTWYGHFTDAARMRTIQSLRTLGWKGDDISELGTLIGGEAQCSIQIEPDLDGVDRARVGFIGRGNLAMKERMSDEQKKAFAASLKGLILSMGGGGNGAEKRAVGSYGGGSYGGGSNRPDDDIPF